MKFFVLVASSLLRRKLRTALTILSIFVAFLLFAFLCVLKEGLTGGVSLAGVDRLIVRHKVSLIQTLPQSYEARIANTKGVDSVVHQTWFGGIYQDPKNFFATMPTDPDKFFNIFPEFVLAPDQLETWKRTRNGAIVGRTTLDRFNWKIGDHVPITSPIWGQPENQSHWDFEIVGVYTGAKKNTDTSTLLFRYDYFDEARTRGKGEVGWYTVRVKDASQTAAVASAIDTDFANSPYETKTEPEGAFAQSFAQQVGDIAAIVMAVLGAVFFTILLVAANTMSQAVRERTDEIGVLKAMGFSSSLVMTLVLLESCLIALIGGGAGLGLALLIVAGGNPIPSVLPVFYLSPFNILLGLALTLALGIVAGAIPAFQAMNLRIADALRRNG